MLYRTVFRILEARGVDRYTLATWEARYLARHHQAILEALVILAVFLLVLLFSGAARAEQTAPESAAARPAMMMEAGHCAARHDAKAADVVALRTQLLAAQTSTDPATLRAAVDAALRHLDRMDREAAACAAKMAPPKDKPAAPADPHVH